MEISTKTQDELVRQVKRDRRFRNRLWAYFRSLLGNWTATIGFIIVVLFLITAVFGEVIAPYHPTQDDYWDGMPQFAEPLTTVTGDQTFADNKTFPLILGTNWAGEDILSRIIYGARSALFAGVLSITVGLFGGILLGSVSGYLGGTVDNILMRVVDAWMSIPSFFMLLIIVAALSDQPWNPAGRYTLFIAMFFVGFMGIPGYARILRGSVLSVREMDFIEAARATGSNEVRIIRKHILPNVFPIVLVYATMGIGGAIMSTAGLSFIGLGARPGQPDWGGDMNSARLYFFHAPHVMFWPGFAIFIVVLGFNLIGDWLRDVLDPRTTDV